MEQILNKIDCLQLFLFLFVFVAEEGHAHQSRRPSCESKRSHSVTSSHEDHHQEHHQEHHNNTHDSNIEEYDRSQFSSFVSADDYLRRDSNSLISIRHSSKTSTLSGLFQPIDDHEGTTHTHDDSTFNPLTSSMQSQNQGTTQSDTATTSTSDSQTNNNNNNQRNSISLSTRSGSIRPFSNKDAVHEDDEESSPVETKSDDLSGAPNSHLGLIPAAGGGDRRASKRLSKSSISAGLTNTVNEVLNPLFDRGNNSDGNENGGDQKMYSFMTPDQVEQANAIAKLGAEKARVLTKEGWEQTKNATQ